MTLSCSYARYGHSLLRRMFEENIDPLCMVASLLYRLDQIVQSSQQLGADDSIQASIHEFARPSSRSFVQNTSAPNFLCLPIQEGQQISYSEFATLATSSPDIFQRFRLAADSVVCCIACGKGSHFYFRLCHQTAELSQPLLDDYHHSKR